MEFACLALVSGRDLLVCPRTMRDGAFQQCTIFKVISEDRFEEIQIRNRFGIFQNGMNYKQTPEACLKAPGAVMETNDRRLLMVTSWFGRLGNTRFGTRRRSSRRRLVSCAGRCRCGGSSGVRGRSRAVTR